MSDGMKIACGVYFISAGNAGYERYMMQGNMLGALFDAALALMGVLLLANGINKFTRIGKP